MSGNVDEWCLNEYENPQIFDMTGKNRRTVRGGSWLYAQHFALCAYRYGYDPDSRHGGFGFRLLCSFPIL